MKKRKRNNMKRKINPQKVFCFISFIFILTCCLWYGGRFVYFYLDSHKKTEGSNKTSASGKLVTSLKSSNKSLKKDGSTYYFYQNVSNNYLVYSNMVWRIVKINKDDSIMLVSNDVITSLAYGTDESDYKDDVILKWLNKDSSNKYSGVLESKLNDVSKYLVKTSVCTDNVTDIEKIHCDKVVDDYYLGLLTVEDYVKTGAKKSFINQNSVFYLANQNKDHEIWYLKEDGSLNESGGDDILGIRPTITLSPTTQIVSGTGSEKDPYKIEKDTSYFGSYVKLDKDMWRVYDFDDTTVKLVLVDNIKDDTGSLTYPYSTTTYRHNDTIKGSLAYYLNHTYLSGLSYKNIILDGYYYNGYYGEDNSFDLKELYEGKIDTKVGVINLGDVIFNYQSNGYFTSTGIEKGSNSVYVLQSDGTVLVKKVNASANVVPCITIKTSNLSKGSGSSDDPYRME